MTDDMDMFEFFSPPSSKQPIPAPLRALLPAQDYAADYLKREKLPACVHTGLVSQRNAYPLMMNTEFKKKYYRFDNKSLQCFPDCSKFEDVREARIVGMDHGIVRRSGGWCANDVKATLVVPAELDTAKIHVLARFLMATPDAATLPEAEWPLLHVGAKLSTIRSKHCVRGQAREVARDVSSATMELRVHPEDVWIFDMTLPRHRRNAANAAHKVPLFTFELMVFVESPQEASYTLMARSVSQLFEIASVRTLIREALSFRQMRAQIYSQGVDAAAAAAPKEKPVRGVALSRKPQATNYSSVVHRLLATAPSAVAIQPPPAKRFNLSEDDSQMFALPVMSKSPSCDFLGFPEFMETDVFLEADFSSFPIFDDLNEFIP